MKTLSKSWPSLSRQRLVQAAGAPGGPWKTADRLAPEKGLGLGGPGAWLPAGGSPHPLDGGKDGGGTVWLWVVPSPSP